MGHYSGVALSYWWEVCSFLSVVLDSSDDDDVLPSRQYFRKCLHIVMLGTFLPFVLRSIIGEMVLHVLDLVAGGNVKEALQEAFDPCRDADLRDLSDTWDEERRLQGKSVPMAAFVTVFKVVFFHLSQPLYILVALFAYWKLMIPLENYLAIPFLLRELLYMFYIFWRLYSRPAVFLWLPSTGSLGAQFGFFAMPDKFLLVMGAMESIELEAKFFFFNVLCDSGCLMSLCLEVWLGRLLDTAWLPMMVGYLVASISAAPSVVAGVSGCLAGMLRRPSEEEFPWTPRWSPANPTQRH